MRLARIHRSERGSLPIALLTVIIVGGIVTVLLGSVVTGQRQTRFDQNFEQALQVADDGLDRVAALAEQKEFDDLDPGDVVQRTMDVPGGSWLAQVERTGLNTWILTSTGEAADGTRRTVEMRIEVDSIFDVAAFGKFFVELAGGNYTDSYRSGSFDAAGVYTQDGNSTICVGTGGGDRVTLPATGQGANHVMCTAAQTNNGTVATNGRMFLRGQDYNNVHGNVEIHYARERVDDALPGATGYCQGVPLVCNDWDDENPNAGKLRYFREELVLPIDPVVVPGDPSGVFGPGSWLCETGEPDDEWDSCLGPSDPANPYVFTDVILSRKTKIEGTPNNPTIVYNVGMLRVDRQEFVNFHQVGGHWEPKPPAGFVVFSSGTGPAIDLRNHSSISAAIYAPNGAATGGAGVNVYGSIVAGSINTQGGWRFHYDEALADVLIEAPILARNWTEIHEHVE